jgi:hypothetical protein
MDVTAMAASAVMTKQGQAQQTMTISLLKMASEQQDLLTALLDQGVRTAAESAPRGEYGFSAYA